MSLSPLNLRKYLKTILNLQNVNVSSMSWESTHHIFIYIYIKTHPIESESQTAVEYKKRNAVIIIIWYLDINEYLWRVI